MKYVLLLLVLVVGFWALKRQWSSKGKDQQVRRTYHDDPRTLRETEPMMRCAYCGVFVPRSAARQIENRFYCTQEHAKLSEQQSVHSDDK